MNHPIFNLIACTIFALGTCLSITTAAPKKRFAIKSMAAPHFVELRKENDFAPMSYVFAKGEFFGDSSRGARIAELDFQAIAKTLAVDLAEQNFLPTTDTDNADMLLVVHWGAIERLDDPSRTLALERALESTQQSQDNVGSDYNDYDPWATRFDMVQNETDNIYENMTDAKMARLLGFDEDLARERKKTFSSSLEETLLVQMQQERFLVIVMAWDARSMRKYGEKQLLWSAHLSMKALGTDFEDAISLMSGAAAGSFGTESDGITSHLYKRDKYKVEMGEIEVLESGDGVDKETLKDEQ